MVYNHKAVMSSSTTPVPSSSQITISFIVSCILTHLRCKNNGHGMQDKLLNIFSHDCSTNPSTVVKGASNSGAIWPSLSATMNLCFNLRGHEGNIQLCFIVKSSYFVVLPALVRHQTMLHSPRNTEKPTLRFPCCCA